MTDTDPIDHLLRKASLSAPELRPISWRGSLPMRWLPNRAPSRGQRAAPKPLVAADCGAWRCVWRWRASDRPPWPGSSSAMSSRLPWLSLADQFGIVAQGDALELLPGVDS